MKTISPDEGVQLLQGQIKRGEVLLSNRPILSNQHSAWENTTRAFLDKCFGADSSNIEKFLEEGRVYFASEDDSVESEAIKSQIQHLKSCVEILEADVKPLNKIKKSVKEKVIDQGSLASAGDPLKRRYQVFVSSTYEDLKEERKHVMHALLQTKCIPVGMELFPAASEEKWDLIKRVIDDSDYFIVIVAGKYGSRGVDGRSYTEMEFDYASSSGRPVIGFYHSNIDDLKGVNLEKDDDSRKRLLAFTGKIKSTQICASWSTAESLGSVIKSALIHAIEHRPMPGWIRANSISATRKIKTDVTKEPRQIDELKIFPTGGDTVDIPVTVSFRETNGSEGIKWNQFDHSFRYSYDDLFVFFAPYLSQPKNRRTLKAVFQRQLVKKSQGMVQSRLIGKLLSVECQADADLFLRILQTFVARRLLKQIFASKNVRLKVPYWQITPNGIQRLAELQAITHA